MTFRTEIVASLLALAFLVASCAENDVNPVDTGEKSDLTAGLELPEVGESDGLLPAYQTEAEVEEAGKADAIDLRASYEEIYGITAAPQGTVRALAEWEPVDGVLVSWTDGMDDYLTNLVEVLHRSTTVYVITPNLSYSQSLERYFRQMGINTDRIRFFEYSHEAFWTRDFGPVTVELANGRPAFVDTSYYWNRRRDDAVPTLMGAYFDVDVYRPRISSEGGNFMTNGQGLCATTTWMLEENTHFNSQGLADEMQRYFGCRQTIILERMAGEGTGHIDMYAKFTQDDTVLVGQYDSYVDSTNAAILDRNAERLANITLPDGRPLQVVRIPMPTPRYPVYGSYTNSLLINNTAIIPSYSGSRHLEDAVVSAYRQALPAGYNIVLLDSTNVIELGGAVHCTTMSFNTRPISSGSTPSTPDPVVEPSSSDRYSTSPGYSIRDNSTTTSVLTVPTHEVDLAGTIDIELRIEHTYVGDLYIVLEHGGVRALVYEGTGPGQDLFNTYRTDLFDQTSRAGNWTLSISDRANLDEGTLQSWAVTF